MTFPTNESLRSIVMSLKCDSLDFFFGYCFRLLYVANDQK